MGNGDEFQPLRNHLEPGGERWRCSRSHRGSKRPERRLGGWSAQRQNRQVEEQTKHQALYFKNQDIFVCWLSMLEQLERLQDSFRNLNTNKEKELIHLEGFDGGNATVRLPLVVVAGERALQVSAGVPQVDGFLHCDVSPVRDLDGAGDAADGQERGVVLIMDLHDILQTSEQNVTHHCLAKCLKSLLLFKEEMLN